MAISQGLKKLILASIKLYRYVISGFLGNCCRFEPSCSHYATQAIELHGCLKGGWLMVKRLLRCHPWCAGGEDPVPLANSNVNNHV